VLFAFLCTVTASCMRCGASEIRIVKVHLHQDVVVLNVWCPKCQRGWDIRRETPPLQLTPKADRRKEKRINRQTND
jgi:hypothetical protein